MMFSESLKSLAIKISLVLFVILFAVLVQVQPINGTVRLLNIFNICLVAFFLFFKFCIHKNFKWVAFLVVFILIVSYVFSAKSVAEGLDASVTLEPVDRGYVSDEKDYLKTFYFMKRGQNYYQAAGLAFMNDPRYTRIPTDIYSWRFPTVFYLWRFLAFDGKGIINLFILLSSLSLFAAFLTTKKLVAEEYAVFSPLALMPYYLNSVSGTSFLFIEWWSLFLFLFSMAFIFNKRLLIGIGLLVLSFAARELMIIPAFGIAFILFFKSKKISPLLVFLFSFLLFMLLHRLLIERNISSVISYSPRRIHVFDKGYLLHVLAFSTQFYDQAKHRIGIIFTVLTLLGFLTTYFIGKEKSLLVVGMVGSFCLLLITPFINSSNSEGFFSDYWAIMIMPLIIIFSPLIFNIIPFFKKKWPKY